MGSKSRLPALADDMVDLACLSYGGTDHPSRREQAAALLATHPGIARATLAAAAALGDADEVSRRIAADPGAADRSTGPRKWAPLLYATYSRVVPGSGLAVVEALLAGGADPRAMFWWGDTYQFTAVTGAFGEGEGGPANLPPHPECDAIARALLTAGADPNDSQALYNRMFRHGYECLEILLEFGLGPTDPSNWKGEPMTTLDYQLFWAATKARTASARLLLEHGADPNARNGDGWSVWKRAAVSAAREITAMLEARGATPDALTVAEQFGAAVMGGDADSARRLAAADPSLASLDRINEAAGANLVGSVALLLDLGAPLTGDTTPLHVAAWADAADVVALLLERGADPTAKDKTHNGTPLGWAEYGGSPAAAALLRARGDAPSS